MADKFEGVRYRRKEINWETITREELIEMCRNLMGIIQSQQKDLESWARLSIDTSPPKDLMERSFIHD